MAFLKKLLGPKSVLPYQQVSSRRDLIRKEAEVGGKLFGAVPAGGSRQFFYLDRHSWVWHEEWTDSNGQRQSLTTRYEIRPTGVLKAQGNQPYHYVDTQEAKNLFRAIKMYYKYVMKEVYGQEVNIPLTA